MVPRPATSCARDDTLHRHARPRAGHPRLMAWRVPRGGWPGQARPSPKARARSLGRSRKHYLRSTPCSSHPATGHSPRAWDAGSSIGLHRPVSLRLQPGGAPHGAFHRGKPAAGGRGRRHGRRGSRGPSHPPSGLRRRPRGYRPVWWEPDARADSGPAPGRHPLSRPSRFNRTALETIPMPLPG